MSAITEHERVKGQLRRAERLGLSATLTIEQWYKTLGVFNWRCAYCGGPLEAMDHVVPIDRRGGTTATNCVPACTSCNSAKGPRELSAYALDDDTFQLFLSLYPNRLPLLERCTLVGVGLIVLITLIARLT